MCVYDIKGELFVAKRMALRDEYLALERSNGDCGGNCSLQDSYPHTHCTYKKYINICIVYVYVYHAYVSCICVRMPIYKYTFFQVELRCFCRLRSAERTLQRDL